MAEVYDFNVSASNNNSASPNGFPEGMEFRQVNDSARELMAAIARDVEAKSGIATTGSSTAYVLTVSQNLSSYQAGQHFIFTAHVANTAAATININGLGAVSLTDNQGVALSANDIVFGSVYIVFYTGTNFRILSFSDGSASIKTKYESNADTNAFTDAEQTKLGNLSVLSASDVKTLYESNADTNAFTDAEQTKLGNLSVLSAADVKTLYESNADTNAFTDAEQTQVANSVFILPTVNTYQIKGTGGSGIDTISDSDVNKMINANYNTSNGGSLEITLPNATAGDYLMIVSATGVSGGLYTINTQGSDLFVFNSSTASTFSATFAVVYTLYSPVNTRWVIV